MSHFKITYTGSSKVIRRLCEIVNGLPGLGTTHEDAYYGDLGKEAYDHSQLTSDNPHHVTAADLGLAGVADKVNAIMFAIGMISTWITHNQEPIVDHDGAYIVFHGVGTTEERNYLLYH